MTNKEYFEIINKQYRKRDIASDILTWLIIAALVAVVAFLSLGGSYAVVWLACKILMYRIKVKAVFQIWAWVLSVSGALTIVLMLKEKNNEGSL